MATPDNGTYIIHSYKDMNLVLDSAGASDRSGANVQFCSFNYSDAQYVTVQKVKDAGWAWRATWRLGFPATGKFLDVQGAVYSQGRNVMQCDWNGGDNQQFQFIDTGQRANYGTYTNLPVYSIYVGDSAEPEWLVEGEGSPQSIQSGSNVCIARDTDTEHEEADRKWVLIPANPVPNGTYEIVSSLNPGKCLDISGSSTGHGARVILYDRHGGNNQKVALSTVDGRSRMFTAHTLGEPNQCAYATTGTNFAEQDQDICQDEYKGEWDQFWVLEPRDDRGGMYVDGAYYQLYQISNAASASVTKCIDVANAVTDNGARVRLCEMNASPAELFAFVPTEIYAPELPTPGNVGFMINNVVNMSGTVKAGTPRLYFKCVGDKFKARYRWRKGSMSSAGIKWDDWSSWRSTYDGMGVNNGWGDAWKPNVIFTSSGDAKSVGPLKNVPAVSGNVAVVQLQAEVKSINPQYRDALGACATGNVGSSGTVTMALQPTLVLSMPQISKDGIEVTYTSDWAAGGCTMAITELQIGNIKAVTDTRRTTGLNGARGTVVVPWNALLECPVLGSTAKATARLETGYIPSAYIQKTGALTAKGNTRAINPTYAVTNHGSYIITPDTSGTARAFLRYDGKVTEYKRKKDGTFDAYVPLNTEAHVTIVEVDKNGTWGYKDLVLPAITFTAYVWIFGDDDDYAMLDMGAGNPPKQDDKWTRNYDSAVTTGREFPATRFLPGKSRDLSCSGVVIDSLPDHGTQEAFIRLLNAGHAIFRNPRGEMLNVAVTGISSPIEILGRTEIEVEQHQESR